MKTINLTLSNLSCNHCVANVKKQLLALDGVENAFVTLTKAEVLTSLSSDILIEVIQKAGYEAHLANNDIHLALKGLSCGHCVERVKKILLALPLVESVEVSLHEAIVKGTASAEILIQAITEAGYEANLHSPK